jgi:hypothetical protein
LDSFLVDPEAGQEWPGEAQRNVIGGDIDEVVMIINRAAMKNRLRSLFGLTVFLLFRLTGWADRPGSLSLFQSALPAASTWAYKIKISGAFKGDLRWRQFADFLSRDSAPASDLYIRELDLGIETDLTEQFSATVVLNSEWLGDGLNQGDEKATVDEAHLDINLAHLPFYLVIGKRSQPIGLFENFLITDPLTMDLYETKKVGLTVGVTGGMDANLSLTFYKGTGQLDHLFQSGLIDSDHVQRYPERVERVGSWILAGSFTPWKQALNLFGALSSEPGTGRRNTVLNLGFNFSLVAHPNLKLDGEWMKALSRELYIGGDEEFKEGTLSLTATYSFVLRTRRFRGTGNYAGRRATVRAFPFTISARYEYFDDASLAAAFNAWTIQEMVSFGGRYTFFEAESALGYGQIEYRRNSFRVPAALRTVMAGSMNEVYLRIGFLF